LLSTNLDEPDEISGGEKKLREAYSYRIESSPELHRRERLRARLIETTSTAFSPISRGRPPRSSSRYFARASRRSLWRPHTAQCITASSSTT
jgi:hypothetical protein